MTRRGSVSRRVSAFVHVGLMGVVVQLAVLALLVDVAGWRQPAAVAAAVIVALLHNFAWHERWTWADRARLAPTGAGRRLATYLVTTGVVSIAGNIALTGAIAWLAGIPTIVANFGAVGLLSVVNFVCADRCVFRRSAARACRPLVVAVAAVLALGIFPTRAAAHEPAGETLVAWDRYISGVEARLGREWNRKSAAADAPCAPVGTPAVVEGSRTAVSGGAVHDWRGCAVIPGAQLAEVIAVAKRPERQEGVLDARVLHETGSSLRVHLKLVRQSLVTATYATEHHVEYRHHSPDLVTSRSVATRIRELSDVGTATERERPASDDRGFLWRLNAYWRFEQLPAGVLVDLQSVTLSRAIPVLIGPMAAPIMNRIARESIIQALATMQARVGE